MSDNSALEQVIALAREIRPGIPCPWCTMPYYNVTAHTLYQSVISANWDFSTQNDILVKAKAWIEAENIVETWKLVQEWFEMMENDTADNQYPDPMWDSDLYPDMKPLTQDLAEEMVEEFDADFQLEKNRFQGRSGPEFKRLASHSQLAFAQAIYRITLSQQEITTRAEKLVSSEASIPPVISKE